MDFLRLPAQQIWFCITEIFREQNQGLQSLPQKLSAKDMLGPLHICSRCLLNKRFGTST